MMDSRTGELTALDPDHPFLKKPPTGTVILQGAEADVRRVAGTVAAHYNAEKAKAKRKAQRQARKRNR